MADITIAPIGDNGVVTVTKGKAFDLLVSGTDDATGAKISKATLTSNGKTIKGKIVVADGLHWAVRFVIKKVDPDHPYTVHIEDDGGKTADTDVTFKDAPAQKAKELISPPSGTPEPSSGFWVTGMMPPNASVYGYMDQPSGPMYYGSPFISGLNYSLLFQDIPASSTPYTITVIYYYNSTMEYHVIEDITVS